MRLDVSWMSENCVYFRIKWTEQAEDYLVSSFSLFHPDDNMIECMTFLTVDDPSMKFNSKFVCEKIN